MIALVILIVVGLLLLASVARIIWRFSRGELQIEPSSHGRQFFGDKDREKPQ
jgi:hypothetical protein